MFDWIGDLFTKIWRAVKRILPYILIACAIWLSMGFAISLSAGLVIKGTVMNALLFLGASFLFAPGETATVFQPAVEAIGDVAQNAAKEVGDVAGSLLGSVSSSLGLPTLALVGGLAVGAYFLLSSKGDKKGAAVRKGAPHKTSEAGPVKKNARPAELSGPDNNKVAALGASLGAVNA